MDYPLDFAVGKPRHSDVYPFIDPRTSLQDAAVGKTMLVTGAGTGIGKAIAQQFAVAGASSVILAGRREKPLKETRLSIKLLAPPVRYLFEVVPMLRIKRRSRPSWIAYHMFPTSSFMPPQCRCQLRLLTRPTRAGGWRHRQQCTRHVHDNHGMGKSYARVINIGSIASWRYAHGRSSYAVSKVAMDTFTEYIDWEQQAAGSDIRCVVMHLGGVLTDLIKNTVVPEAIIGRMTDKAELSSATAVYLSTERANFLMGRVVLAIWDMEELEKQKGKILKEDLLKTRVMGVSRRHGF